MVACTEVEIPAGSCVRQELVGIQVYLAAILQADERKTAPKRGKSMIAEPSEQMITTTIESIEAGRASGNNLGAVTLLSSGKKVSKLPVNPTRIKKSAVASPT